MRGNSLFESRQDFESFSWFVGEYAKDGRNHVVTCISKKRQARVAKAHQIHRSVAGAAATLVLPHRDITDSVQAVLDTPVSAPSIQKLIRVGAIGS